MSEALIRLERTALGYGRRVVLRDVDLCVREGDFLGIVGPNGSGKTTLLRALLGVHPPLAGRVEIATRTGAFGYVPQRELVDETFPLTVREMILMGRYARIGLLRRPGRPDQDRVEAAAAHVGIAGLLGERYRTLSGGQKQRALIARALVSSPRILVLDEPTNGMDLPAEKAIMDLVLHLHTHDGLTVVMVSHLLNVLASYVQRLAVVGRGRLEVGSVEAMLTAERLSALYGIPVAVERVGGRAVVLPARGD